MLITVALFLSMLGACLCTDIHREQDIHAEWDAFGDAEPQVQYRIKQEYVRDESGLFRLVETKVPVTRILPNIHRGSRTDPTPRRIAGPKKYGKEAPDRMLLEEKFETPKDYERSKPIAIPAPKKVKKPGLKLDPYLSVKSGNNGKYNTTGCDYIHTKLEEFGNAMHDLHRDIFTI